MSHTSPTRHRSRRGFTLVELLVSIAILALLAGLTVKGVRKFREAAWATDTQNQLSTIANAVQTYYSTFNAYPGPLPNIAVGVAAPNAPLITFPAIQNSDTAHFDTASATDLRGITGTENLVLGLCGGLKYDTATNAPVYDPKNVGQGPSALSPLAPKKYGAFLEGRNLLSWKSIAGKDSGKYSDDVAQANDTVVPELVDRFPQGMPILYLRADRGAAWNANLAATPTNQINNVITDDSNGTPTANIAQYHLNHIKGYTATAIGESKKSVGGSTTHGLASVDITKTLAGDGPYDAYPYLVNTAVGTPDQVGKAHSGDVPRKKDDFILISPGIDRIYGTKDDITSFGSVTGG